MPSWLFSSILYSNPKAHKAVISNTQIWTSFISSKSTYLLAKYLNTSLSLLNTNECTVKNSFNFAEKVVSQDCNLCLLLMLNRCLLCQWRFSSNFYNVKLTRKYRYSCQQQLNHRLFLSVTVTNKLIFGSHTS